MPLIILGVFFGLISIFSISSSPFSLSLFSETLAQSDLQTTKYRNMVIDLDNGLETNARLNLPANGDGPFPGVLLIAGSGMADMNETGGYVRIDNETGSKLYPTSRPLFDIAKYLSERGFAVLQYDKRSIGENVTILDSNVWGNITIDNLKQDAEKALDVLVHQPEVDANDVSVVGHSEGTLITPRIAIDNPGIVDKVVLMAPVAINMSDLIYIQGVTNPINYAQQILDHNHNGLISVQEASENPVFDTLAGNLTLLLTKNITTANGTLKQLSPQFDVNNDTSISIDEELKPRLIDRIKSISVVTPGEKCDPGPPCPMNIKSEFSLIPNLDIIGKVPSDISILIQHGKNDSQIPIQQAFLLQQELTEVRHPDHTLITYPDLGHFFYPSSQWLSAVNGPTEDKVLEDLFSWLSDPVRDFKEFTILLKG
ncbi:MAG: prolyl oligopeptidase family serine peptidase [Candidatus Nitrosocosmicus sp.]|nr:prolyl oligopeptidase family serine peptidase [Candidatus Nitrosocosmicus sp.]